METSTQLCAPVLFLTFNRPETTERVFDAIRKAAPRRLYVSVDGPREGRPAERAAVGKVREIVRSVDWPCEVKYRILDKNSGCRVAVQTALDWFFENEEEGIVLEDDCLPHSTFFDFSTEMLCKHRDDQRVMMVAGTNYLFGECSATLDAHYSRYYSIWGWATWRRAWSLYDDRMAGYPNLKAQKWLESVFQEAEVSASYYAMFDQIFAGKIDTWDLQWVYTCLKNFSVSVVPRGNLVSNIGHVGTHTGTAVSPYMEMPLIPMGAKPWTFPESVHPDFAQDRITFRNVGFLPVSEPGSLPRLTDVLKNFGRKALRQAFRLVGLPRTVLKRVRKALQKPASATPGLISSVPSTPNGKRALLSYLRVSADSDESEFFGHTNRWESWTICRLLVEQGYIVDSIDWDNSGFELIHDYHVVIDIHRNLERFVPLLSPQCVKILHLTGSFPEYSVAKELQRVEALETRTGKFYSPKRIAETVYFNRSIRFADRCSMVGNEYTRSTYPALYHSKIERIRVSSSPTYRKGVENYVPEQRNFLWFYGFGAVHKGLDLVLEVFMKHPEWHLHVVGAVAREKDFMLIYGDVMSTRNNIHLHGELRPDSDEFQGIVNSCFSFIAPSCSEGTSTAAVTCLQVGLYPIYSVDNGLDIPNGYGQCLSACTVPELEKSIEAALNAPREQLLLEIQALQNWAVENHSRSSFLRDYGAFLLRTLATGHSTATP